MDFAILLIQYYAFKAPIIGLSQASSFSGPMHQPAAFWAGSIYIYSKNLQSNISNNYNRKQDFDKLSLQIRPLQFIYLSYELRR